MSNSHHDFKHVLRQFFLETWLVALVDDDDFNSLLFAEREYQFRAKAQQAVLVGG